jgi:hypothetical protein
VDVQKLAERSDSVGRIVVSAMFLVVVKPPVMVIAVPERVQIVDVAPGHMGDISEELVLGHGQSTLSGVRSTIIPSSIFAGMDASIFSEFCEQAARTAATPRLINDFILISLRFLVIVFRW